MRRERDIIAGKCPAGSASAPAPAPASPAGSAETGYSGPPADIEYSIWGDPAEIKNQQAIVDAFTAANPTITVNVTVSDWDPYWDKLQTGLAGGDAPDVFAMDGPLGPDYQTRDVLLDLTPYIEGEGYDLSQLDDNAVKDFTTADGAQFGLPRDLNVIALFYNKEMFDDAGIAYPDDTWDWAKLVEVGKQLTKDTNGDGTPDQWGVYTETTDMENAWSSFVWQAGGDILTADGTKSALDYRSERAGHPVPPGPDLEGEGLARSGDLRRDRRCLRAGRGGDGDQRLVARADARGGRARLRHRATAEGPGGPGDVGQPDGGGRLQGHQVARRRRGRSSSTWRAPRPRRRSWR